MNSEKGADEKLGDDSYQRTSGGRYSAYRSFLASLSGERGRTGAGSLKTLAAAISKVSLNATAR